MWSYISLWTPKNVFTWNNFVVEQSFSSEALSWMVQFRKSSTSSRLTIRILLSHNQLRGVHILLHVLTYRNSLHYTPLLVFSNADLHPSHQCLVSFFLQIIALNNAASRTRRPCAISADYKVGTEHDTNRFQTLFSSKLDGARVYQTKHLCLPLKTFWGSVILFDWLYYYDIQPYVLCNLGEFLWNNFWTHYRRLFFQKYCFTIEVFTLHVFTRQRKVD